MDEILGYDLLTNKFIKTSCKLSERQCHVMAEVDDGMILVGFGWQNKNSLNDLYLFNSKALELIPIQISNLRPDNGMDCQWTKEEIVVQGGYEHGCKLVFDRGDLNNQKLKYDASIKMAYGKVVMIGGVYYSLKNSHNMYTEKLEV